MIGIFRQFGSRGAIMKIIDIRIMLLRAYIRFLLSEVSVIPKKDFEVVLPYTKITLHVGEERRLPRFIARILKKHDIVEIKDDYDERSIMGKLISFVSTQGSKLNIIELPKGFYYMVAEAIRNFDPVKREKIKSQISNLMKTRLPRIIHRIHTEKHEGLDYCESDILKMIIDLKKAFEQKFVEETLYAVEILNRKKKANKLTLTEDL